MPNRPPAKHPAKPPAKPVKRARNAPWNLEWSPKAEKSFNKILEQDVDGARRLEARILALAQDPSSVTYERNYGWNCYEISGEGSRWVALFDFIRASRTIYIINTGDHSIYKDGVSTDGTSEINAPLLIGKRAFHPLAEHANGLVVPDAAVVSAVTQRKFSMCISELGKLKQQFDEITFGLSLSDINTYGTMFERLQKFAKDLNTFLACFVWAKQPDSSQTPTFQNKEYFITITRDDKSLYIDSYSFKVGNTDFKEFALSDVARAQAYLKHLGFDPNLPEFAKVLARDGKVPETFSDADLGFGYKENEMIALVTKIANKYHLLTKNLPSFEKIPSIILPNEGKMTVSQRQVLGGTHGVMGGQAYYFVNSFRIVVGSQIVAEQIKLKDLESRFVSMLESKLKALTATDAKIAVKKRRSIPDSMLSKEELEKRKQRDDVFEYLDTHAKSLITATPTQEILDEINSELEIHFAMQDFTKVFNLWQNPPFPFNFCPHCDQFGEFQEEDRETEYDEVRPQVCQYFESDSFRPDTCPLGFPHILESQVLDEDDAQEKYAELAYYLKAVGQLDFSKETLDIAQQEAGHEQKVRNMLLKFTGVSKQTDSKMSREFPLKENKELHKKILQGLTAAISGEQEDQGKYPKIAKAFEEYGIDELREEALTIGKQEAEHEQKFKKMQVELIKLFGQNTNNSKK